MPEEEKKSNIQIKREWEADEVRKDKEREQWIRVQACEMIMHYGIPQDKKAPWLRANKLFHYFLTGSIPDGTLYEGFV